ncbi:MAG: hypothetical protein EHM45_13520 [Desulfobacteraceae bacterium]|nr:MAG: hypothetical protein EHM45_13520 [Desulfobacteraceae bacterium]
MYCTKCGQLNQPTDQKCSACGQPLQNQAGADTAKSVSNYLVPAILTTVFCCLPFGIVAIVYAAQVNSKLQEGDYDGAVHSSRKAKIWSWVSFGIGIFVILIGIIAAIAIPQFVMFRERANTVKAHTVLQEVCTAKEAFFLTTPDKEMTLDDLAPGNIVIPPDIDLSLEDGTAENFTVVAVHKTTGKTFVMKRDCNIEELRIAK